MILYNTYYICDEHFAMNTIFLGIKFSASEYPTNSVPISNGASTSISESIFVIKFRNRSERIFLSDLLRANILRGVIIRVHFSGCKVRLHKSFRVCSSYWKKREISFSHAATPRITLFASQFRFTLFHSGSMQGSKIAPFDTGRRW